MEALWHQTLVMVVVVVVGLCSAQDIFDSLESDSNESFRPSPQILDSAFIFRPRPRGGRSEFQGPSTSSPSVFPPPPSFFSSPPSSSSETSHSSYSSIQPSSPSTFFSSPSLSFSSNRSPSSSSSLSSPSSFIPSSPIVQATGVKLHDTSSQDSHERFGSAPRPSSSRGYSGPTISNTGNSHGVSGLVSPPSQSYGPPLTPGPTYNPSSPSSSIVRATGVELHDTRSQNSHESFGSAPSSSRGYSSSRISPTLNSHGVSGLVSPPSQSYDPPSPQSQSYATPGPTYNPSSPSPHHQGSRRRLSSLESFEIPDNNFADSIEIFISPHDTIPPHATSSSDTFNHINSQSVGFSNPQDRFSSHETLIRQSTFNPSSSFSLSSSKLRSSTESFHSPDNPKSSSQGFPTLFPNHLGSSNTFRIPSIGSLTAHDSVETSSSELFLRTRKQPRPISTSHSTAPSVQGTRPVKTSFVGDFPNYFFNYDVNESTENDGFHSLGQGKKGPNFGHSERREGSRTEGRYYVELPDGRTQVVEYFADETGYHPTITYI